ncbi:MAG: hypothetical protein AB7G13_22370 [Lautropia sp.]
MATRSVLLGANDDPVGKHLDGEQRAARAIDCMYGDPDAITRAITRLFADDGVIVPVTPRLLGFGRALRKALEART